MYRYRLLALTGVMLLAGCAGPGIYLPPVEDRSDSVVRTPQRPVEQDTGVRVTPIYDEPVIRQQRIGGDSGLSAQPSYPNSASDRPVEYPRDSQIAVPSETQRSFQGNSQSPASDNPAVVALLDNARQQQSAGSLAAAQTSLERAQRIAPRDPMVYYQLADVQRQLQQFPEAEQLARRGIALAAGQTATLRKLWLLIASIRKDSGDLTGARDALDQARRY